MKCRAPSMCTEWILQSVWLPIVQLIASAVVGIITVAPSPLYAQQNLVRAGHGAEAQNMQLLGHSDLQARSAYQPAIQRQGNRWIVYIGHHGGMALNPLTGKEESNGTSIVDVTDPAQSEVPRITYRARRVRARAGGAQMVRVVQRQRTCPRAIAAKVYLLRTFGNVAHEIWDVTTPERPRRCLPP